MQIRETTEDNNKTIDSNFENNDNNNLKKHFLYYKIDDSGSEITANIPGGITANKKYRGGTKSNNT